MTTIAVIGTSGVIGAPLLKELQASKYSDNINYPIKAISSKDRSSESTDKIEFIQGQLTDEKLADQFKNIDVVISLLPGQEDALSNSELFLSRVRPALYIPPEYGTDNDKLDENVTHPMMKLKLAHVKKVRDMGIKSVRICTGYFRFGYFLHGFVAHIGIDLNNQTVTYVKDCPPQVADGGSVVQFTTCEDLMNCITTIALSDPTKLLDDYRVYSDSITVKEVAQEKEKELGITLKPIYKTVEELKQEFKQTVDSGNPDFVKFLCWLVNEGPSCGVTFTENEREKINPGESLWKWGSW